MSINFARVISEVSFVLLTGCIFYKLKPDLASSLFVFFSYLFIFIYVNNRNFALKMCLRRWIDDTLFLKSINYSKTNVSQNKLFLNSEIQLNVKTPHYFRLRNNRIFTFRVFRIKFLQAFLIASIRSTHPIIINTLIILGKG